MGVSQTTDTKNVPDIPKPIANNTAVKELNPFAKGFCRNKIQTLNLQQINLNIKRRNR